MYRCLAFLLLTLAVPAHAEEEERSHCFARFCISLPASFVRTADEHVVREVSVEEKRWHNPLNRERAGEFAQRLKTIEASAAKRANSASLQGTVLQRDVIESPRMEAVFFHRTDNPFAATWGALHARGPLDLWLQADADVLSPRDAWPRLAEVARAYRVPETDGAAIRAGGMYHLRFGALALAPRAPESADVSFEAVGRKIRLRILTATVNEAKPRGLLERAGRPLPAPGKDVSVIRGQVRLAGGMAGDELVTRPNLAGGETISYRWTYAGDAGDAQRPKITIAMEGPASADAAGLALWSSLLASLQPARAAAH